MATKQPGLDDHIFHTHAENSHALRSYMTGKDIHPEQSVITLHSRQVQATRQLSWLGYTATNLINMYMYMYINVYLSTIIYCAVVDDNFVDFPVFSKILVFPKNIGLC